MMISFYTFICIVYFIFLIIVSFITGEKQAAVHHDQWNAARMNYQKSHATLFMVLTSWFILHCHILDDILDIKCC